MFNPAIYENSQSDGFPVLEVLDRFGPEDRAEANEPVQRHFVPLQRTELQGVILGPLANLHLTQIFHFARCDYDGVLEACYRFPLPGDAAVTAVTVRFGAVEVKAAIQERKAAEAAYGAAKAEGRQAALATRETPNVFTLQVAGLKPDEPITVETEYIQLARTERVRTTAPSTMSQWSLRIPLTTTPRYVRSDKRDSAEAQGQPLLLLRDPGHRFTLDLHFHYVDHIESPTHSLITSHIDSTAGDERPISERIGRTIDADVAAASIRVQLADGEVLPDRDCLLRWSPPQDKDTPTLSLFTHYEQGRNEQDGQNQIEQNQSRLYFLALVVPPKQQPMVTPDREAILLVDHSGSMRGPKWSAADWAIERFLHNLDETDTFALAMFHYKTRWFAQQVQPATMPLVDRAVSWLGDQQDSGGTELGVALEQALQLPSPHGVTTNAVARNLLIVTDAAVSDASRIFRLADNEAKRPDGRRISLLCIDAAPNAYLANELAQRGGGVARFLTSDPDQVDIVTALDDVLHEWEQPIMVNLKLTINQPKVQVNGYRRELYDSETPHSETQHRATNGGGSADLNASDQNHTVIDLGNLTAGRPQWVAGCVLLDAHQSTAEPLSFRLTQDLRSATPLAAEELSLKHIREIPRDISPIVCTQPARGKDDTLVVKRATTTMAALKALYGANRVNALEYLMHAGLDEQELGQELLQLGYDPTALLAQVDESAPVYAENRRQRNATIVRPLLVQEALTYGLPSSETAFVATRTEGGQPVERSVAVANALPAGWSDEFVGGPMRASLPMAPMFGAQPSLAQPVPRSTRGMIRGATERLSQHISMRSAESMADSPEVMRSVATDRRAVGDADEGRGGTVWYELFSGVPIHTESDPAGQSTLFHTAYSPGDSLPDSLTFAMVELSVDEPNRERIRQLAAKEQLAVVIYVGDLVVPRATVQLSDLLRSGKRPLNLRRERGEAVQILLIDPTNSLQTNNVSFSLHMQGTPS